MDHSLILSHLPKTHSHLEALKFSKERGSAPGKDEILAALEQIDGDRRKYSPKDLLNEAIQSAEKTEHELTRGSVKFVSYWSENYPKRLRELKYPPWNLFYIGNLPTETPTLAIVGSRKPSPYGASVIAQILPYIQVRPLQVISGLALGIDAIAHHYSCECSIPNFAVLGGGVDVIYPPGHAELSARILDAGGGILSEFPPGALPLRNNFPWRNRIVSGLSDVVWIIQATAKSGTRHTIDHALSQSIPVAATPGDIFLDLSEVPNRLLLDGAHCILRATDLDLLLGKGQANLATQEAFSFDSGSETMGS